jgi:putative transposase
MRRMGIEALYRRPRTSIPARGATIYPYLLENLVIDRPNRVWASDLMYLPMTHGFLYLMAILRNLSGTATSPIQWIVARTWNVFET